jgi:AcrR family transcriptional regulator
VTDATPTGATPDGTSADHRRRLTRQGRARKAELLNRAAELFAERGYSDTRVIDIVKAAGVAKGLFYWYFENKEALFRELVAETRRRLRHEQASAMDGVEEPLQRIYLATRSSVVFMAEHRQLYALLQIEGQTGSRFSGELRDSTAVHARDTAVVVEAGQRQGTIRTDEDATTLAYLVLGTVLHMVYFHRTERVAKTVDELARSVAGFVTRGLAASEQIARDIERELEDVPLAATH